MKKPRPDSRRERHLHLLKGKGFEIGALREWARWCEDQFEKGYSVHNHVWVLQDLLRDLYQRAK